MDPGPIDPGPNPSPEPIVSGIWEITGGTASYIDDWSELDADWIEQIGLSEDDLVTTASFTWDSTQNKFVRTDDTALDLR